MLSLLHKKMKIKNTRNKIPSINEMKQLEKFKESKENMIVRKMISLEFEATENETKVKNFFRFQKCIASGIVSKHWHVSCVIHHRRNTKLWSKDKENRQNSIVPHSNMHNSYQKLFVVRTVWIKNITIVRVSLILKKMKKNFLYISERRKKNTKYSNAPVVHNEHKYMQHHIKKVRRKGSVSLYKKIS